MTRCHISTAAPGPPTPWRMRPPPGRSEARHVLGVVGRRRPARSDRHRKRRPECRARAGRPPGRATRASRARAAAGAGSPRWRAAAARVPAERRDQQGSAAAVGRRVGVGHASRAAARAPPSVRTPCGGTNTTAEIDGSTGDCWAHTSSPVRPLITNPPSSAGATLSGWPSMRLASDSAAASSSRRPRPSTRARASTMPPTMAADDEPRPRLCGIRLVQARCRPGWGDAPSPRRRRASNAPPGGPRPAAPRPRPRRRRAPRAPRGRPPRRGCRPARGRARGSRSRDRGWRWSPAPRR